MSPVVEAQWLERLQTRVETTGTKQRFLGMTGAQHSWTHNHCAWLHRSSPVTGKGLVSGALLWLPQNTTGSLFQRVTACDHHGRHIVAGRE